MRKSWDYMDSDEKLGVLRDEIAAVGEARKSS